MSLKIQAKGVTEFLDMVYGRDSRPSALLEELGCTPEQVTLLRDRHLEALINGFVRRIAERLAQYHGGERKYWVLARRLGLDGEQPATLAALGVELGVSRERIRQIEQSTMRRCRFQRRYWLEALYTCAADLLMGDGIALQPFDPERAQKVARTAPPATHAPAPATPAKEEPGTSLAPPVSQETLDRLHEAVNAIFAAAGDDIADDILADLLSGSIRPVIVALVEHYTLQFAHGAFRSIDRKRLKALVRDARHTVRHPAVPPARREDTSNFAVGAPAMEEVAQLVAEIRACRRPQRPMT